MTSVLTRNYVIPIPVTYLNVALWLIWRVQWDCPLGTKGRVLCPTALIVTKWCRVSLHLSSISSLICSLRSPAPRKISLGQVTFITGSLPRIGRVLSLIINPCLKSNTMSFLIQLRSYTVLFFLNWMEAQQLCLDFIFNDVSCHSACACLFSRSEYQKD